MNEAITYSDGSANHYRFELDVDRARFVYTPVTPEQSSTGTYSGGDPKADVLDDATTALLWQLVLSLENNVGLHETDRGKGTGAFAITGTDGETRRFIIRQGAELKAFDDYVRLFLQ